MTRTVFARLLALAALVVVAAALLVLLPLLHRGTDGLPSADVHASPRDTYLVTEPIRLSSAPDIVLRRGVISLPAAARQGGQLLLDQAEIVLNASGLRGDTAQRLAAGTKSIDGEAPLVVKLVTRDFDKLSLRDATLTVVSTGDRAQTVSNVTVDLSHRKGSFTAKGSFGFKTLRFDLEGTLATPQAADASRPARWPLTFQLKNRLLQVALDGQVTATDGVNISGHLDASAPKLRSLARSLGVTVPAAESLKAAKISGDIAWAQARLAMENAKVAIDGNEATGAVMLSLDGDRPLVDASLAFQALNLSPYFATTGQQATLAPFKSADWQRIDLAAPIARDIDADLRLSASAMTLQGIDLGRCAASIVARAGKVSAQVGELAVGGGIASAQIVSDQTVQPARYEVRGRIEAFDPSPPLAAVFGQSLLTGRVNLSFDVAGKGFSAGDVVGASSGRVGMTLPDGESRLSLNLAPLKAAATRAGVAWPAALNSTLELSAFEVRGGIGGGSLRLDSVRAASGPITATAIGNVDIASQVMALRLSISQAAAAGQKPEPAPVATTFTLDGAWKAPILAGAVP